MSKTERHPTTEVLLKALDGELSPGELKAVRSHLQACWKCRKESGDIESTVHAYTALATRLTSPERLNPPNSFRSFQSKLKLLEEAQCRTSKGHQYRRLLQTLFLGRIAFRFQIALLVVGAVLLWTNLESVQIVSASELLSRASQTEIAVETTGHAPGVFQEVAFRLNRRAFTRSTYHDMVHRRQMPPRFAAASGSTRADMLSGEVSRCREVMQEADLDFDEPLSPIRFKTWLANRKQTHRESVAQLQDRLRLTSRFEEGPIHSAELVLRQVDYHAVEERFRFADNQELEITELAYEVRSPRMDEVPPADRTHRIVRTAPGVSTAQDLRAKAEKQAESQREEMQARVILHRMGADLGEQVSIEKAGDDLTLTGIVESTGRKNDLLEAFKNANGIHIRLQTVAEATAEIAIANSPTTVLNDKSQVEAPLLAAAMKEVFDSDEHRQEYVRGLLSLSDQGRSHAFALRQLAQRYPPELAAKLPADCQEQLRDLVHDHLKVLHDAQEQLRQLVAPFVRVLPDTTLKSSVFVWQSQALQMVDFLQREHNDLVALFAGNETLERTENEVKLDLKNILERDDIEALMSRTN